MALTLTGANSIITLGVTSVFPTPQQIQGFSAEDVFDTEDIEPNEISMGIDGILSMGWVNVPTPQEFSIQANSPSGAFFDTWYAAMKTAQDAFPANGIIRLPSLNAKFTMTNGSLTRYKPVPGVGKLIKPRKFRITWESAVPSPL